MYNGGRRSYCNKRGRCVSCSCVKVGKQCSNCLPLTEDHCDNSMSANSSIVTPAATRSSLNSNLSSSSPIDLTVDTSIHPLSTTNPLNTDHSVIVSHPTSSITTISIALKSPSLFHLPLLTHHSQLVPFLISISCQILHLCGGRMMVMSLPLN